MGKGVGKLRLSVQIFAGKSSSEMARSSADDGVTGEKKIFVRGELYERREQHAQWSSMNKNESTEKTHV